MARMKLEKAQAAYEQTRKQKPAGEGGRFRAMVKVGKARGMKDPEAFAAFLGRKRYGKEGMAAMAAAGRKRS